MQRQDRTSTLRLITVERCKNGVTLRVHHPYICCNKSVLFCLHKHLQHTYHPGSTQLDIHSIPEWGSGLFSRQSIGRGVKMITDLHLLPRLRMSEAEAPFPIRLRVVQGGKLPSSLRLNIRNTWLRKILTQWAAERQIVKSLWKFPWENSSIISTNRPSTDAVYKTVSKKTSLHGSYVRN